MELISVSTRRNPRLRKNLRRRREVSERRKGREKQTGSAFAACFRFVFVAVDAFALRRTATAHETGNQKASEQEEKEPLHDKPRKTKEPPLSGKDGSRFTTTCSDRRSRALL